MRNKIDKQIINCDLSKYLKIGDEYEVYGIRFDKSGSAFFVIYDDGHLVEAPSQMFNSINPKVSPLWEVRTSKDGDITIWPSLFYEENFFENFSEWEDAERARFNDLIALFDEYDSSLN